MLRCLCVHTVKRNREACRRKQAKDTPDTADRRRGQASGNTKAPQTTQRLPSLLLHRGSPSTPAVTRSISRPHPFGEVLRTPHPRWRHTVTTPRAEPKHTSKQDEDHASGCRRASVRGSARREPGTAARFPLRFFPRTRGRNRDGERTRREDAISDGIVGRTANAHNSLTYILLIPNRPCCIGAS